ncbi:glycosyltransferase family 4 protein [Bradyrhizobium diazoefficiens]|nr:glycosyltransferase family 4 protein [Bradyrhizobium diazoefficiens]QQN61953.1 glycosyltransferase family 4 protein [Bradyrhizobium diazoefficiens]
MPGIAICNNMVTPYTNRLFNHIVDGHGLDLTVISCAAREKNRQWSERYAARYSHILLRGIEFDLPGSRSAHINVGMWSTLSRLSPDLVAINGVYPTMLVAAAWSRVHRKPLVFLTDGWAIMMPQSVYHRLTRPAVVGRCRAIICASAKGRDFFVEQGADPKKIFVANIVPAWGGPADIPEFARRRYDLLWCGRVNDERKNWPFFVKLVLELKRRLPTLSVRIIADSPSRPEELDQLSTAEVAFEYTSHVPPEEISSVFASARMLALPSKSDAWGLVCNEAMQCGTPCIVSPFVGAADELVIDDACGLVRPLEVEPWAAAILRLVGDAARWSAMSRAAVQAAAQLNLDRSARRYVDGLNLAAAGLPPAARKLASAT